MDVLPVFVFEVVAFDFGVAFAEFFDDAVGYGFDFSCFLAVWFACRREGNEAAEC